VQSYNLVIRRSAERDLEALPAAVQSRVIAAIFALRENPRMLGRRLSCAVNHL
jgi:mRNA-degrading endonuclease RelE of RelBE toxin-antitoxin system